MNKFDWIPNTLLFKDVRQIRLFKVNEKEKNIIFNCSGCLWIVFSWSMLTTAFNTAAVRNLDVRWSTVNQSHHAASRITTITALLSLSLDNKQLTWYINYFKRFLHSRSMVWYYCVRTSYSGNVLCYSLEKELHRPRFQRKPIIKQSLLNTCQCFFLHLKYEDGFEYNLKGGERWFSLICRCSSPEAKIPSCEMKCNGSRILMQS